MPALRSGSPSGANLHSPCETPPNNILRGELEEMKKPWMTKEWREKRKIFIKDKSCLWCSSTIHLSIHHPQPSLSLSEEEYASFEGCEVLCKRCHFAFHKGLYLCPKCKRKYAKPKYETCFDCLPPEEKKEIEERQKEMEDEEEVPLINFVFPCGLKGKTYVNQLEWGILEACLHICPKEVNINDCEILRKKMEIETESEEVVLGGIK